ncbi:ribokinase [Hydrogenophaga sp. A37]|uniref:ribokinase n=1 Tax=Hydrogenophaga sp. A37 TaxID=1945864 RepID=UPI0009873935|nr:ribokinase [Hydrogenophaga sp. A37]OOG84976.1 ribokinase [Hydrogenophaga sp. A37]
MSPALLPKKGPDVVVVASWNADFSSRVARPPARGETLMGDGFEVSPGGKGSNAAVAAARQGARVAVLARIGRDDFGRMALALWTGEGIDTQSVEQAPNEPSGVAQILTYPDGDNSIVVSPGANAGLGPAQVVAAAPLFGACRVVLASFEVPLPATLAAFRLARAAGARTVLNPAPARALPVELAALVNVLTPNETELATLSGIEGDRDRAAQALLDQGVAAVLVTLGAQGAALYRAGQPVHTVPGHSMTVKDTIGAGDAFNGALAAALARGEPLEVALHWANAAAALSVRARGAIAGMPSFADTAALLQDAPP